MYVVTVALVSLPDAVEDLAAELRSAVRTCSHDPGCVFYSVQQDTAVETRFLLYERWDDRESFDQHGKSDFVVEQGQRLARMLAADPVVTEYELIE
ncbi:antibiotic biosynthesis monooxygenase [Saccharopolyspora erythraea]|uniref:putative quinol monooxygenase n=1 Tax=Saccharopolyspora erythraea TaxID=1836 RepID=UPI001BA6699E|nr:putative quinol monooxygenase [Saccharopolyspora erythraea]QUH02159.1 antibiotic biosynthesis monooxygenase [Saccharopolyspora erythraea]